MKIKLLATALTVSLPLAFGGAYAQSVATGESGNNRSGDGGAVSTNPAPPGSSSGAHTSGTTGEQAGSTTAAPNRATDGSGTTGTGTATGSGGLATGADGSGTAGSTGTGAAGTGAAGTGATGASTTGSATPSPTAPGMEAQGDAASTEAITGWSAKDDVIGKSVFNENDEKIGDISDIVISSDGRSMYLLVGAGGFLGMGAKDVAIPFDRFQRSDDRLMLSGYTKEQLKALPEVRTQR